MDHDYSHGPTNEEVVSGIARVIFMPVGHVGERLAIAIVGQLSDARPFSRVVTSKLLKCLPNDLGHACLNFGSIVATDFDDFVSAGRHLDDWQVPLGGLKMGELMEVGGGDLASVVSAVARMCALWGEPVEETELTQAQTAPRASEEARFFEGVREEVIRRRPRLKGGFKRAFSLAGGHANAEIDFVGSRYATCYAAINPKSRQGVRLTTASAGLWRLARARDAFGFAAPATMELTAWVPPDGLPIYAPSDYELVSETIAELKAQAAREQLGVCSAKDFLEAAKRLVDTEGESYNEA